METSIDMAETGRKIRRYMIKKGYSVKMLQEYLCLSCPQPIYRWFKGKALPTVEQDPADSAISSGLSFCCPSAADAATTATASAYLAVTTTVVVRI